MPFLKVFTNAARSQLPRDFMPRFSQYIAAILEKDPKAMKWTLNTDVEMAMGCEMDAPKNPFVLVEVESLAVFKTEEKCEKYIPQIFDYLMKETHFQEDQISTKFRSLELFEVGAKSKTMAQILKAAK